MHGCISQFMCRQGIERHTVILGSCGDENNGCTIAFEYPSTISFSSIMGLTIKDIIKYRNLCGQDVMTFQSHW